jgi:hypothetical protein
MRHRKGCAQFRSERDQIFDEVILIGERRTVLRF